ncbi:MAG: hypothetical protein M3Y17_05095 [Actinomycetota bacterium]|nr:hypothetical protein [Actinomycetota bacterium]
MAQLTETAYGARAALLAEDRGGFARCVNASFDARRAMMALHPRHVEMIERARACGASANYSGSGGAVVAVCRDERQLGVVKQALAVIGCDTVRPTTPAPALSRARTGTAGGPANHEG